MQAVRQAAAGDPGAEAYSCAAAGRSAAAQGAMEALAAALAENEPAYAAHRSAVASVREALCRRKPHLAGWGFSCPSGLPATAVRCGLAAPG